MERHGIVLEAARGPVPALAIEIVGGPIRGSWWGHAKGPAIYSVCSRVRESPEVLVCKLVEGRVTFVHRRLWAALVRLADEIGPERLEEVRSVHTAAGKHVNLRRPFPEWVPEEVSRAAARLSLENARAALPEALRP